MRGWIACASVLGLSLGGVASAECLAPEPAEIELSGKLTEVVFPGRPNYESIAEGDEPETAFILELDAKICLTTERELESKSVHLVLIEDREIRWEALQKMVGRRIACNGSAWNWITAHHHAPILLTVKECRIIDR